ncbi:hypothetical protein PFLUV_G00120500 [Perca fluviatilis]|uniref:Uncharacterized protein n=1 Tax=Perca fluviatilis TaxID=8168 RepID=A0A6A5F5Z1_PERFL|nr:hypothetical protein PFLUV_G00120500 [Perca fluviatilis]
MMKFVLALVVLLHFCSSYEVKPALNGEMISRLEKLNILYKGKKVHIPLPMVRLSKIDDHKNASSCVSVFATKLKHLLNNMTVPKQNETILVELKANLKALPHPQTDHKCPMVLSNTHSPGKYPFKSYINFLMTLNSKKR